MPDPFDDEAAIQEHMERKHWAKRLRRIKGGYYDRVDIEPTQRGLDNITDDVCGDGISVSDDTGGPAGNPDVVADELDAAEWETACKDLGNRVRRIRAGKQRRQNNRRIHRRLARVGRRQRLL